ncbi:hypothetical protein KAU15_01995, partial [candidate division WOR-3 bacterium]|nr:hypothetical protein [candidate division WOR-3 bacterium]
REKICKLKIIFYNDDYTESMQNEYYYDYTINKWENDRINSLEPDIKILGDTALIEVKCSNYFIINGWRNSFGKSYIRIKPFEINDSIYVLKVNSGIPFEYVENNLCMKDFNINDFNGITDIDNNGLSKHELSRGRNLLILFDVNSESSISTINNLFKNELLIKEKINNVYILAISDKSKTHDYFKDFKMDYDIYFVDEQIIKSAFKTDVFPSILLLNNGELIMWLEGLQTGIYKVVENILK